VRRALAFTAAGLCAALSWAACTRGPSGPGTGDLVPDFVLPRLDGSVQKLSNYRGKVVLVNMWATWCPPCIEELPLLDRIQELYGPRGLVVLGLAGDDDPQRVRDFLGHNSVSFEVLLDVGGEVGTQYGITGYPETFVVDREGRLRNKLIGPLPADAGRPTKELNDALEAVLGG
jgi:thiol-disulfide isomerase/thioredoxin